MLAFTKTQTAKVVLNANGDLTGITTIDTDAGMLTGAMKHVGSVLNGGEDVVVGLGHTVGEVAVGYVVGGIIQKIGDVTGVDPYFGLLGE